MARVVLWCDDVLGAKMAGPAIRYWELAKHLSSVHDVLLVAWGEPELVGDGFEVAARAARSIDEFLKGADVLLTQVLMPSLGRAAGRAGTRIVLDCYDPMLLEVLEAEALKPMQSQRARNRRTLAKVRMGLDAADAVVCAHDRQRDLWLGSLMAQDRITPAAYHRDPSLEGLVGVVPYGLPDVPAQRTGPGLRERLGIDGGDFLIVWGGGVWDWFDPLTLIRAVDVLVREGRPVHLAFLGLRHPNERVPDSHMAGEAIELARQLGLLNVNVHLNEGWTPYAERQNSLLDADVGVSTHFAHLETRFAFRTRMLDYLWCGLPMLATEGDAFAELIERERLGVVVPTEDVDAISRGLKVLMDDRDALRETSERVLRVSERYTWTRVAASLDAVIAAVMIQPSRPRGLKLISSSSYYVASVREALVDRRYRELCSIAKVRLGLRG